MTRLLVLLWAALLPTMAPADTQEALILSIEAAGTNAHKDRRHSVEINGCQMTTYRWSDRPEYGWVLWSSFQFDMVDARLKDPDGQTGNRFEFHQTNPEDPTFGLAIIQFKMREGTVARFERSELRPTERQTRPSPRGDGTAHHYLDVEKFLIMMEGPGMKQKAATFAEGFVRYTQEYCTFSS